VGVRTLLALKQHSSDFINHPINILKKFIVPISDNPIAIVFQPLCPLSITLRGVLSTINLNNELGFRANKINDIVTNRRLPPKPVFINLLIAQPSPKPLLRISRVTPQLPGNLGLHSIPPILTFPHKGGRDVIATPNPTFIPSPLMGEG
jgi:hypothetical protein